MYDANGMVTILGACLTNLSRFGLDADLEELNEIFEPHQVEVLMKLYRYVAPNS